MRQRFLPLRLSVSCGWRGGVGFYGTRPIHRVADTC